METGGGFGVGVTLVPLRPAPRHRADADLVYRRARLSEVLRPERMDDAAVAAELARIAEAQAQLAAYQASVIVRLTELRPDLWDLTPDQPGAGSDGWVAGRTFTGVTEFFADELALVLGCSRHRAHDLADVSLVLVNQLPTTWGAVADGRLDWARAVVIAKALGWQTPHVDPDVIAAVERTALDWALDGESLGRLHERTCAALLEADDAAADRRRKQAQRHSDVRVRPGRDGMAELVTDLPAPVAAACRDAVDQYARMWKADGDTRPIGQLRSLVLADLVLRPWDTTRPPVTAHVTITAPLAGLTPPTTATADHVPARGDQPGHRPATTSSQSADTCGTVDSAPITAAHLRDLLRTIDALCPGGLQAPAEGSLDVSLVDPVSGALRATVTRTELERLVRHGCPDHPQFSGPPLPDATPADAPLPDSPLPAAPVTDQPPPDGPRADPPTGCNCALLGAPPPVDRYTPTPAQRRHVRARDRTCRHPGCRRPAARTDIDHVTAHADGGATACDNLCCLCRRHHRIKTHARGWTYAMNADGVLSVTTPSGVTRTTRPPGTTLPADVLLTPVQDPRQCADDEPDPFEDDPPPF